MGRPTKAPDDKAVKIGISLSGPCYRWAIELAQQRGFTTNFSAFFSDLVRRERERDVERQAKLRQMGVNPDQNQ